MERHTTNYADTFIGVAEDCPVQIAEAPPEKEPKSLARLEYEMLIGHPYQYTSDDVIYETKGKRMDVSREAFFAKGQPCFRASALAKRYGWGIHSEKDGTIALYAVESEDYRRFAADGSIRHLRAMRQGRK